MRIFKITKLYILTTLLFLPLSTSFADDETIPIPRKRPAIMSVSQSYIDALMARKTATTSKIDNEQALSKELNDTTPSAPADSDFVFDDDGEYSEIENIDVNDIIFSLDNNIEQDKQVAMNENIIDEFIPVPSHKPVVLASATNSLPIQSTGKKALISFTLEPDQIDLDSELKQFLVDYAIGMFKSNQSLKMEIYAYATPEDGQEYSDVRRSLARALEVRRFLLKHNIQASQLKIIPVGLDPKNKANNRIDLVFITPKSNI